ncbi:hypothetical protein MWU76_10120 [Gelidibacter sp. F2691]|uniref:hypothetical protein n=1 Tax=uncultured Gelidibacter sp. TaxID=259318 RepID=UPI001FF3178D|nr:hypothetical protein [uncultured Gelidibacter sp.]MCK0124758.1 hypothetical protein [Gelidibacter sp. F2691]
MKEQITKNLLCIVTIGLFASCDADVNKKLENKLYELELKTESLDSMVNREMNNIKNFDSFINFESDKIKKLDSVVTESSSKIDSMVGGKLELLKEIIN